MNIFVVGASGYVGGTVADKLVQAGHRVRGLVRTMAKARLLEKAGIEPVIGSLDDGALLGVEAFKGDGVVNAASSDHRPAADALIAALSGTGKFLIHTSGSSVIGDSARGSRSSDKIFDEDTPFLIDPLKQARRDLDLAVLKAAENGTRSIVICPSLIYGVGKGLNPDSVQIPFLAKNAREQGAVQLVGQGLNTWSNVHIDDVADLYIRAVEKAPPGAFYFAENGEASFGEIGEAIGQRLGLTRIEHLPADVAVERWGEAKALYTLGSNSRVRAKRARRELGWDPRHSSAINWILSEMPI